jgi:ABC-type lipoprotein release transport system permease subunit
MFFTGIQDGSYRKMIDVAARMGSGHITLENKLYRNDPDWNHGIPDWRPLVLPLTQIPGVLGYSLRVSGQGMLTSPYGSVGAAFDAIDPKQEQGLWMQDKIIEGRYLETTIADGIIVGDHLARQLKVGIGSKVVLTINNRNNHTRQELLRVRGIFHTGSDVLDSFSFQIPLARAQEIVGLKAHEVLQIALFLQDFRDAESIANQLRSDFKKEHGLAVWTWQVVMADLARFIAIDRAANFIIQGLLFSIVAIGMLNTVLMSVMERRFEFGVLLAIGFSPARLFCLIMIEVGLLGFLGLALGSLMGWGLNVWFGIHPIDLTGVFQGDFSISGFAMEPALRTGLFLNHYIVISTLVYLWLLLVGLYPAMKAARLMPVSALASR